MPGAGIDDFEALRVQLAALGSKPAEKSICGWAGTPLPEWARGEAVRRMQANSSLFEVFVPSGYRTISHAANLSAQMTLPDQISKWSCLVDVRGNGFSGRVPLLLHSGRPILFVERQIRSFYSARADRPPLQRWQHYIPVKADLSDLLERADWVLRHPRESGLIGARAQQYAQQHLTRAAAVEAMAFYLDPKGPFTQRALQQPLSTGAWTSGYCAAADGGSCVAGDDAWAQGVCGRTPSGPSDCVRGKMGSWEPVASAAECVQRCIHCERCNFISFSPKQQECSWFFRRIGDRKNDAEGVCDGRQPVGKAIENLEAWPKTTHATVHIGKGLAMCGDSRRHAQAMAAREEAARKLAAAMSTPANLATGSLSDGQRGGGFRRMRRRSAMVMEGDATFRAPNPTPMPSMSADGPSVLEWLNASRPGVCVTPTFSFAKRMLTDEDRCMIGTTGTFRLTRFSKEHKVNTLFVPSEASGVGESRTWEQAVASCLELCATCARCRHISVSPTLAYCAWHHRCDATGERDEAAACGVLSGAVYTNERE